MKVSITLTDSGQDRVTMTTDAPEIDKEEQHGPATPASIMLVTIMGLFESRGLELLGHYVLKGMEEGKLPSETLKDIMSKIDEPIP